MDLKKLAEDFINSYANPNTQRAYRYSVFPYLKWLAKKNITQINKLSIKNFNEYSSVLVNSKIRLISAKLKLHIIFSFYKYLYDLSLLNEIYLKRLAIPRNAPTRETPGLTDNEAIRFLNADYSICETRFVAIRDRLIFHILLYLGLRIEELSNLDVEDIILNGKEISTIFIKGKGGFGNMMGIKKSLVPLFKKYLKIREKRFLKKKTDLKSEKALIITSKGAVKRLSLIQIRWLIKYRREQFGFKKKITPHWFRVTAISHLSEKKGIREAYCFARHKSIVTTEKYDRRRSDILNHPALFIDYVDLNIKKGLPVKGLDPNFIVRGPTD